MNRIFHSENSIEWNTLQIFNSKYFNKQSQKRYSLVKFQNLEFNMKDLKKIIDQVKTLKQVLLLHDPETTL